MRIALNFAMIGAVALATTFAPRKAAAQDTSKCLYNDEHFHVQGFKVQGPRLPEALKMMDNHVCRTTLMSFAMTLAHAPLIDRDFAPVYYTQTDGRVVYYNAIQDVLVAHKFLALPEQERALVDPLVNAFNLKDARAGDCVEQMVHLYPGVWSGFGEIHFKKQEFSEKLAGGRRACIARRSTRSLTESARWGRRLSFIATTIRRTILRFWVISPLA